MATIIKSRVFVVTKESVKVVVQAIVFFTVTATAIAYAGAAALYLISLLPG